MEQQVRFYFAPNRFRKHQSANAGSAKGQDSFIESPARDYPARENIRIEEEPESRTFKIHGRLDLAKDFGFT